MSSSAGIANTSSLRRAVTRELTRNDNTWKGHVEMFGGIEMLEVVAMAVILDCNITVVRNTVGYPNWNVSNLLGKFYPEAAKWTRNVWVLHHTSGGAFSLNRPRRCNKYGLLIPTNTDMVNEIRRKQLTDSQVLDYVLRMDRKRMMDYGRMQKRRGDLNLQMEEREINRDAKRKQRMDNAVAAIQRARNKKYMQMARNVPKIAPNPLWKKMSNGCESVDDIMNRLTGATMTNDKQDMYLAPPTDEDMYFALNKYSAMMMPDQLPIRLCGVCGIKYKFDEITLQPIREMDNFLLLAAQPRHRTVDPFGGNFVVMEEALFYKEDPLMEGDRITKVNDISECEIEICTTCKKDLSKARVPRRSLWSFDSGRIPKLLLENPCTFVERMLLSMNRSIFHIYKVQNPNRRWVKPECQPRVSKGHAISFKHSFTSDVIKKVILPLTPEELAEYMLVSFIGDAKTEEEARRMVKNAKQLKVRPSILHMHAKEMARLNPAYISHDTSRWAEHEEETVPSCIYDMVDFESVVIDANQNGPTLAELDEYWHDDYARRDQVNPELPRNYRTGVVQKSGMIEAHAMRNGPQEHKKAAAQKLNKHTVAIPVSEHPVNDYAPDYFVNSYRNVFIHGVGSRPDNVPLDMYCETIMLREHNGAALDFSLVFEMRNVVMRHRTLEKVRLAVKAESADFINAITDVDLEEAIDCIKNKKPISTKIGVLLKHIETIGADVRGFEQHLNRCRSQILYGAYVLLGAHDVWITLNPQESSSQIVLIIAGARHEICFDIPEDMPGIEERMQICAERPMAVAQAFEVFVKAFFAGILGLPYDAKDFTPTHKSFCGYIIHYYFNKEMSGKATGPHLHGQLKVLGLVKEKLIERINEPAFCALYKAYLTAAFTNDIPNEKYDIRVTNVPGPRNDKIRERRKEEERLVSFTGEYIEKEKHYMPLYPLPVLPLSTKEETDQYLEKRLIRTVRESGIHEHSQTCTKGGHGGGDDDCRMGYPMPLYDSVDVGLDESIDCKTKMLRIHGVDVKLPRNHAYMVPINKTVTLALGSNTAIQYMSSAVEGRTKALYTTNYQTKQANPVHECVALIRTAIKRKLNQLDEQQQRENMAIVDNKNQQLKTMERAISTVTWCLNALSGAAIVTGFEASDELIGNELSFTSAYYAPINGWTMMYTMLNQFCAQSLRVINAADDKNADTLPCFVGLMDDYKYMDIEDSVKPCYYAVVACYRRCRKSSSDREDDFIEHVDDKSGEVRRGRKLHERIRFKESHPLNKNYHLMRLAKLHVPYFVGRRYPARPKVIEVPPTPAQIVYAQFMLAMFKPWSMTSPIQPKENETWWTLLEAFLETCQPWVRSVISNMQMVLEKPELLGGSGDTTRVSKNSLRHADDTLSLVAEDTGISTAETLRLLEIFEESLFDNGHVAVRPKYAKEELFRLHGMAQINEARFLVKYTHDALQRNRNRSKAIRKCTVGEEELNSQMQKWKNALKELERCVSSGSEYDMKRIFAEQIGSSAKMGHSAGTREFLQRRVEELLHDPFFVSSMNVCTDSRFEKTDSTPSWDQLETLPSIVDTMKLWNLSKSQSQFVLLVLNHFHETIGNKNPEQLLAMCPGAPGTGKTQTLLAILWHVSQHGKSDIVATCAYTGGPAMSIDTPLVNSRGCNKTARAGKILVAQLAGKRYCIFDEFSHLHHVGYQIHEALGERACPSKPFSGMNMIFMGDFEQLPSPIDLPMYYGALAEECTSEYKPEAMLAWFQSELTSGDSKQQENPFAIFDGRQKWRQVTKVVSLRTQQRQDSSEGGQILQQRLQALREENLGDNFFDELQNKALGQPNGPDMCSPEWQNPLYIVMRHNLRIPLDYKEALQQARLRRKRLLVWKTVDVAAGQPLPSNLQAVLDTMNVGKIPKHQYFYEGMEIAFIDNKYFDAGNCTNNLGYAIAITLHPEELDDDPDKDYWELKFMPKVVMVYVPNSRIKNLSPDLPDRVIPMMPGTSYKRLRLDNPGLCRLVGSRTSYISITRLALQWLGTHSVTQYFSQGMSLKGRKCLLDLRIPPGSSALKDYAASVLVMLSRHRSDDDWALLAPLWTPGNHLERRLYIDKMRALLKRSPDLKAELNRVQDLEDMTVQYIESLIDKTLALKDHFASYQAEQDFSK